MENFNFQFENLFVALKNNLEKNGSRHSVIWIIPCQRGVVSRCCIILIAYKSLHRMLLIFNTRSIRNRYLVGDYVSRRTGAEQIFKVTQQLRSKCLFYDKQLCC